MSSVLSALPYLQARNWPRERQPANISRPRPRFAGTGLAYCGRPKPQYRGTWTRKKFTGQTLDAAQKPVPGATVMLFRTLDRLFIEQSLSDANGYYELYSPYGSGHFIVGYLSGSTDIEGTSVNTLIGI